MAVGNVCFKEIPVVMLVQHSPVLVGQVLLLQCGWCWFSVQFRRWTYLPSTVCR